MGTTGEIRGNHKQNEIEIIHFSGKRQVINPERVEGGHDGADTLIMQDFIRQVRDRSAGKTSAIESARSHLIAFAAEHSRITGQTVIMEDYVKELKEGILK